MYWYVYCDPEVDIAYIVHSERYIEDEYLTEFESENEAWDYAENLSVAVITDDIPIELWEIL